MAVAKQAFCVRLPIDVLELLNREAARVRVSPAELARDLITRGLAERPNARPSGEGLSDKATFEALAAVLYSRRAFDAFFPADRKELVDRLKGEAEEEALRLLGLDSSEAADMTAEQLV